MKKNKSLFVLVALLLFYIWTKWEHRYDRPWAYSYDSDKPLLLGKWEGEFRDPDGIPKHMVIEIDEPEEESGSGHYEDRQFEEAQTFKGHATITSKVGIEQDRVKGGLGSKDGHSIERIDFIPLDELKQIRESFNVSDTTPGGKWEGDTITLTLAFTYRSKTGSAYSDFSDPRYSKKVPIILHRIK